MKNILITGGAGFIGSHVVRRFVQNYPNYHIYNLDALTYAGNLENIKDIENESNYTFVKGDIVDESFINDLFAKYNFEGVLHLAAESHVDRSIEDPLSFVKTNVIGTMNLLMLLKIFGKEIWKTNVFTMSLPMRFMVLWVPKVCLQKQQLTIPIHRIQHQKPVQIIL